MTVGLQFLTSGLTGPTVLVSRGLPDKLGLAPFAPGIHFNQYCD